jgi:hypothetical protein
MRGLLKAETTTAIYFFIVDCELLPLSEPVKSYLLYKNGTLA